MKILTVGYNISMQANGVEIIKKRLAEEINNSPLTKTEIAERVGVSSEMITQYCTTSKLPRLDTFAQLCKTLNVSSDYLLGLSDNY